MIYALPESDYPKKTIEEISYKDENDFEWKIARTRKGFYVRYYGHGYFKENMFSCSLSDGTCVNVKNTNCIFFKDTSFDAFVEMREILKCGYTDEIWESLEEFFTERFEHDKRLLECEVV